MAIEAEKLTSVSAGQADAAAWKGDLLVIGVFEDAFETKGKKYIYLLCLIPLGKKAI